jgi:hypothetical protein
MLFVILEIAFVRLPAWPDVLAFPMLFVILVIAFVRIPAWPDAFAFTMLFVIFKVTCICAIFIGNEGAFAIKHSVAHFPSVNT